MFAKVSLNDWLLIGKPTDKIKEMIFIIIKQFPQEYQHFQEGRLRIDRRWVFK
jgi:hypothetical protein